MQFSFRTGELMSECGSMAPHPWALLHGLMNLAFVVHPHSHFERCHDIDTSARFCKYKLLSLPFLEDCIFSNQNHLRFERHSSHLYTSRLPDRTIP
jgi:hypothetical protein